MPTFWTQALFDPFGFNGIGSTGNVARYVQVRQDNMIGYYLPSNLGGFYGQFNVAAGEAGTSGDKAGRYVGGQIGFRAGPFDVALAASTHSRSRSAQAAPVSRRSPAATRQDVQRRRLVGLRLPEADGLLRS